MNTIKCEICGKDVPAGEAIYYEEGEYHVCDDCFKSEFVECEHCGAYIPRDDAYNGLYGHLCEYCHDDLFG